MSISEPETDPSSSFRPSLHTVETPSPFGTNVSICAKRVSRGVHNIAPSFFSRPNGASLSPQAHRPTRHPIKSPSKLEDNPSSSSEPSPHTVKTWPLWRQCVHLRKKSE